MTVHTEHFTVNETRLRLWKATGSSKDKTRDQKKKKSRSPPGTKSRTSHLGNKWMQIFNRHSATILWACMSDQACESSNQNPNGREKAVMGAKHPCTVFPKASGTCWVAVLHTVIEFITNMPPMGTVLRSCCWRYTCHTSCYPDRFGLRARMFFLQTLLNVHCDLNKPHWNLF